ncbi:RsmB/NOP family class I SAM-dependent RNA methyltransferase [Burkholderiaceae bacterium DAT-1]|nr:RsmB/NOP family class I SAM-dependent RNA methyltransferase [Burkholderiaceae bacterium DAT-1]
MTISHAQLNAAIEALRLVLPFTSPADGVISRFFRERPKIGSKDRAFIAELVFGVLRHKRLLDAACAPEATPRRLALAWLVRNGYNPRMLEDITKEDERTWLGQSKAINRDTVSLDIAAELPDWVVGALQSEGVADADILSIGQSMTRSAPLDIRVNTQMMKRDDVLARLLSDGFKASATPYSPYGIRLEGKPAINRHPLFEQGTIEVQDEGSQLLGMLVAPRRGEMVTDFCAGAGGKTLLLGMLMNSTGRLYAFDVSEKRLTNLKPRLARSGLSNVQPQRIESENDTRIKRLAGKMDRVLVDAPCSGLGTLRRNPDLKFRQTATSVAELNAKQASILESASRLVKAGGRLVYATCSILPAENEHIVRAFLERHPEFELTPASQILADQRIELDTGEMLKLHPQIHGCDGFFAAAMTRKS